MIFSDTPVLSSSILLKAHQSVLRLLQDDDEDIRQGAATIVVDGISESRNARPIVQVKAYEMWWAWILKRVSGSYEDSWIDWLFDLAIDRAGFGQFKSCFTVRLTDTDIQTRCGCCHMLPIGVESGYHIRDRATQPIPRPTYRRLTSNPNFGLPSYSVQACVAAGSTATNDIENISYHRGCAMVQPHRCWVGSSKVACAEI